MLREKIQMTYLSYKNHKGYMGHWTLSYTVSDVRLVKDGSLICDEYTFKDSKIFKGKKFKSGDKIQMLVTIYNVKGEISLKNYAEIEKVGNS